MQKLQTNHSYKRVVLFLVLCLFVVAFICSIVIGKTPTSLQTTIDAFFNYDSGNTKHVILTSTRLSRAIIASVVGISLAISGALMQALTRNPLAAPDILGINSGALFFIVFAVTFFSVESLVHYMWIAFLGAGVAGVLIYILGFLGREELSPIKIILSGAAITALFVSFTQGLLVIDEQGIQTVLFWLAGSVAGRELDMLLPVLPFMIIAVLVAILMGKAINILMSGEDIAKGLGQRTLLLKLIIGIVVVFLAGGSVAVAGAIGFVGLIVPHMVRGLIGNNYRWIIPFSGLVGAILMLVADIVARLIILPQEMPVGVITALIGTPFFIFIARKGKEGVENG